MVEDDLNVNIRRFNLDDYEQLINLWERSDLSFKRNGRDSLDKIKNELNFCNNFFYVLVYDGKLVGSIFGTHDGRKGWINRLVVDPVFRRKGFARILVNKVEFDFLNQGIEIFCSLIEKWNVESMKFFRKLNYIDSDVVYFSKRISVDI